MFSLRSRGGLLRFPFAVAKLQPIFPARKLSHDFYVIFSF